MFLSIFSSHRRAAKNQRIIPNKSIYLFAKIKSKMPLKMPFFHWMKVTEKELKIFSKIWLLKNDFRWRPGHNKLPFCVWTKKIAQTWSQCVTVVSTPVWTRHSLCSKLILFKMIWQTFKVLFYPSPSKSC